MPAVDWQRAAEALEAFPDVVAAWAFGSARGGDLSPGSDLDIATLFASKPSLEQRADLREALQTSLGVEEVDLVILPTRSPLLAMEAVCGSRLLVRDPDRVAEYVSQVAREAEDETAFFRRGLALHSADAQGDRGPVVHRPRGTKMEDVTGIAWFKDEAT